MGLRRLGRIVRVLLAHGLGVLAGRYPPLARRLPNARLTGPERLRTLFEDLGGTFVKFGQMLALQPDVLPLAYCNALFKLLDRIAPVPWEAAEAIFRQELGRSPGEVFDAVERAPIATASVGQVYAGFLGGRKVAIKIQRPNVEREFAADIRLMIVTLRLIRALRIRAGYWLVDPVSEFIAWSREELDYRYEARYGEELYLLAAHNPAQRVPEVYAEFTTRRTLVAEYLNGTTLLGYLRALEEGDEVLPRRLAARGFDRHRFAAAIVDNFIGDAFRHGIYHADLHPANLIILDGSQVGYIDFGITGQMSRYSRRHLLAMTLALARGDLETIKSEYLKITVHDAASDIAGFRAGIDRLAAGWYEEQGGERRLKAKITPIFTEMLQLSRATRVMPERDIVKYIRSAIAIDGLLGRFAPGFDIGRQLAVRCAEILSSEARRGLLSSGTVLAWSDAGNRLLYEGPARMTRLLEHLAEDRDGDERHPAESDTERLRVRALTLGAAALGAALLATLVPQAAGLGFNLWTAELGFAGAAALSTLAALRRLA